MTAKTVGSIVSNFPNPINGVQLSKVSRKDRPWDKHRFESDEVARLYEMIPVRQRLSERMRECSRWLEFALNPDLNTGEISFRLKTAQFCRVRNCPVCQWRRSLMWVARFMQKISTIDLKSHKWLHLTLTVQNVPVNSLRETLRAMNKSWQRLIERKFWPAVGFIRTTEITRSKKGEAHPHFHALLLVPASYFGKKYISHAEWVLHWADVLRADYLPSVRIQKLEQEIFEDPDTGEIRHLAPVEVLKYAVKPADLVGSGKMEDAVWLDILTEQTHKLRFISTGGILKDILQEEERTNDDLINVSENKDSVDESLEKWWFLWFDKHYRKRLR